MSVIWDENCTVGFTVHKCVQNSADEIANSTDADQTASWSVWSGFPLFAQTLLCQYLEFYANQ